MSQGATTPVSVKVAGRNLHEANGHARKIQRELKKMHAFRDVHIAEPIDYPTIEVEVDRERAAQFGLSMEEVSGALTGSRTRNAISERVEGATP